MLFEKLQASPMHDLGLRTDPNQMPGCVDGYSFATGAPRNEPINVVYRCQRILWIVNDECWDLYGIVGANDILVREHDEVIFKACALCSLPHCRKR